MGNLRSVLVGILIALFACVLEVIGSIAIPIGLATWQARFSETGGGIMVVSVAIPSWPLLLAALVGFAIGFIWDRRRARRKLAR